MAVGREWQGSALVYTQNTQSSALKKRIDGKIEFTLCEIEKIAACLTLDKSEVMFIFFDEKVS